MQPKSDIHTWIYPWISISTATLHKTTTVDSVYIIYNYKN